MVSTACENWAAKLQKGEAPISDAVLDAYAYTPEAERFARVFRSLPLADLTGNPTFGEAWGEESWIEMAFRCLAGSFDSETGERDINTLLLAVPKKNSKTTCAALAQLALMLTTRRPGSNFPVLAPTLEIANLAFRTAADAVTLTPDIDAIVKSQDHLKRLSNLRTQSTLRVIPASPKSATGMRAHVVLVDEIHTLAASSTDADRTWAQIVGAGAADPGAAVVVITTQSERPPTGIWRELLDRARAVRDGERKEPGFLPVVFEPWPDADLEDRKVWAAVNPSMGKTVTVKKLEALHSAAVAAGPAALQIFRSQHLNAEPTSMLRGDSWKVAELWADAVDPMVKQIGAEATLEQKIEAADLVVLAVDMGGLWDSGAMVLLCRSAFDGSIYADARGYITQDGIDSNNQSAVFFRDMIAQNAMKLVQSGEDVADIGAMAARIMDSGTELIAGLDPWQIVDVQEELLSLGLPEESVVGVRQGVALTSAIDQLERMIGSNKITHSGSPYLSACIGNCAVVERGQARAIIKQNETAKIDAAVALVTGVFCLVHGAEDGDVEVISPWLDPYAAAAVWAGETPISSYPPPDGADYWAIA